jgi:hypothetical protein
MKEVQPGTTVIRPCGWSLKKSSSKNWFTYLLFDIDILCGISSEKTWKIHISNFRAFRNNKGAIQIYMPPAARMKGAPRGGRLRSNVFLNADYQLDLIAYIEKHFGSKLPSATWPKIVPRYRAETPEEAIEEFERQYLLDSGDKDTQENDTPE